MQVENSLGSLLFANQNPTNTQSVTDHSRNKVEGIELGCLSQTQHETSEPTSNNHEKQIRTPSNNTTASTKIFPWMKESRNKPKQTG